MADNNDTNVAPAPAPSLLQKGLGMLFGKNTGVVDKRSGMVPSPQAPAQPGIMPTMDLKSPNNILTAADSMENGK